MSGNPIAWLRDLQPEAEDEALAVCWKGDPGAFPVYGDPSYASSQAEIERLRQALQGLDDYWTADFPEGPDGSRVALGGFGEVSEDTMAVWRNVRAALSGSKE